MEDTDLRTTQHSIPTDILDDILTRFIICVPESAKQNLIRICFQIELAHWFYLDFHVGRDRRLKTCTMHEFASHVFQHIPSLRGEYPKLEKILSDWKTYKQTVPTYGAIILSEGLTHVLLVQSYFAKSSWGFPKGKVNEEEDPVHCAVREVLEETGFDITKHINADDWLEAKINDQQVRLYVVKNIPIKTKFQPKTRNEIKACEWFAIDNLPNSKKDSTPKVTMGVGANSFFMVMPFVKRIKQICNGYPVSNNKRLRHKSTSNSEDDHHNTTHNNTNGKYKGKTASKVDNDEQKTKASRKNDNKKVQQPKRQLFGDERTPFSAPSWLNFKFDKTAIMECIP